MRGPGGIPPLDRRAPPLHTMLIFWNARISKFYRRWVGPLRAHPRERAHPPARPPRYATATPPDARGCRVSAAAAVSGTRTSPTTRTTVRTVRTRACYKPGAGPRGVLIAQPARRARAQADIAAFETVLDMFSLDIGRYPTTEEGLRVLYFEPETDADRWRGPYLKKPQFRDPWGSDYVYRSPGIYSDQPYEIVSYGKDAQEGGEGDDADVPSWVEMEAE